MAATLNTELLSTFFSGDNPQKVATAAAIIGGTVYVIALVLSFLLPVPRVEEAVPQPAPAQPEGANAPPG